MPTTFPRLVDNYATTLAADHPSGGTSFALTAGSGAALLARLSALGVSAVNSANPVRFSVVVAAALDSAGRVTDATKVAVYRAASLSGDVLGTLTREAGSTEQLFVVGSVVAVYWTAEDVILLQTAVAALEAAVAALGPAGPTGSGTGGRLVKWATGSTLADADAGAFNQLSPLTTLGDVMYASAANVSARLPGNTAATRKFLAQAGDGTASAAPAWAVLATADVPQTGLVVTQHRGAIVAAADGPTVTFDLAAGDTFAVTLGGNRTLALANAPTASPWAKFTLVLKQDGTGSRAVTWFAGILWAGGTAPTLTAANKRDTVTFIQESSGVYLGYVAGTNQ